MSLVSSDWLEKNIDNVKFSHLTETTNVTGAPQIDSLNDAKSKVDGSHLNSSSTTRNQSRSKQKNDNVHIHWDEYNIKTTIEDKKVAPQRTDEFVRMELHYQATLLDKDKLLHDKEKEIQSLDQKISLVKLEMNRHESNNKGMLKVVNEYESGKVRFLFRTIFLVRITKKKNICKIFVCNPD